MGGPSYHARTHLPGGTDPIQFPAAESTISFAVVESTGIDLTADPGVEQALMVGDFDGDTYTNDDTLFDVTTTPGNIEIQENGWYMVAGAIDHADEMPGIDRFFAAYGDAAAAPGPDVLLAQGSNMDIGSGTFTRQTFHLMHVPEAPLVLGLYVDLSSDTTVALAKITLSVWKLGV